MKIASGVYGTISNRLTFTLQVSRKRREKGDGILFEEMVAENFSNLEKKIDIQIQKALRVPKKDATKETHTTATYDLKCQKSKTRKEFKRSKRQTTSSIQGNPHRTISRFFRTNFTIQKMQKKTFITEYSPQQSFHSDLKERQSFPDKKNLKGVHHH